MLAYPVVNGSHLHHGPHRHIRTEHPSTVGSGKDGLAQRTANLATIHIESSNKLDVGRMIASDTGKHHARNIILFVIFVEINSLDESRRAVTNAGNRHFDFLRHKP